ncbi:MAG TPA: class I SAM-dependent methyltransferase [Planktothrix sp.]
MLTLTVKGIEEYAQSKTDQHSQLLDELTRETHAQTELPQMLTGPLEGTFLKLMVAATGAKRILEIGMFTGYSALMMAEGLPAGGHITTLDIDPKHIAIAKKYFARSEHGKNITVIEGPALESLKKLDGPFDLVFIDADKPNYINYYEHVLKKMPSGGVILADNVLWNGEVLNPKTEDGKALAEFNDHVHQDKRVEKVLLTLRDGVLFIRKK